MSKATKALVILKKNLDYYDLIELVELISADLEELSQDIMKASSS